MWNNISQQISEDFGSFQGGVFYEQSPEDFHPRLNEEVDEQFWYNHSLLSRPSFIKGDGSPQTCIRVVATKRRWKNAHGEGECVVVDSYAASSWGKNDYADMAVTPFIKVQVEPKTELVAEQEIDIKPVIEPEVVVEPIILSETKRVRIQVTLREGGEYVAGRNGNFMLQGALGQQVTEMLKPLEIQWPKCVKSRCSVRVQIQDLVDGKMYGGGNYQLHNADVTEVCEMIRDLVGDLIEKGTVAEVVKVVEVPKIVIGVAKVWEKWKDAVEQCPDCGCGEQGNCLCKILAEMR
jgi:hypothetical protein